MNFSDKINMYLFLSFLTLLKQFLTLPQTLLIMSTINIWRQLLCSSHCQQFRSEYVWLCLAALWQNLLMTFPMSQLTLWDHLKNPQVNVILPVRHECTYRRGECNVCRAEVVPGAGAEPPWRSWRNPLHWAGWSPVWPEKRKQGAVRLNQDSRGQRLRCSHGKVHHYLNHYEYCCCSGRLAEFAVGE